MTVSGTLKSTSLRALALDSDARSAIARFVENHPAWRHPLFEKLRQGHFTVEQAGRLLKNYDAHASQLRRLLLKTTTIMPEKAVGLILENVRNEYGNGREEDRHQLQLQSLAFAVGVSEDDYREFAVEPPVRTFIKDVTPLYFPLKLLAKSRSGSLLRKAAIASGSVTATELMAVEEFKALQVAFSQFGQKDHIWFDHVQVECEHSDESVALALYFIENYDDFEAVEFGLSGVLDANLHLYDGLISTLA